MEIYHLILESNIINFILFAVFVAWLIYKSLPEALKSKNENLKEELKMNFKLLFVSDHVKPFS